MNMRKNIKKVLALMLTVALLLCANIPVFAAVSPSKTNAYAGQVVTLKYTYSGIAGINGTFTYSNPDVFSDIKFTIDGLTSGLYSPETKTLAFFGSKPVNCTITLKLTVSPKAKIGDSCNITLQYETTVDGSLPSDPDYKYDKVTVTVVEKLDHSALKSVISQAEGLKKSIYTAETFAKLETALKNAKTVLSNATTQKEINAAADSLRAAINALEKLPDYTALQKQIKIAEALNKADYTAKTWDVLSKALEDAKKAQSSKKQTEIDTATKNLKNAIANLVSIYEGKLKFDELNQQIAIAEGLKANDYAKDGWNDFTQALQNAKKAKSSKLQGEIDTAAAELKAAIDGLTKIDYTRLTLAIDAIEDYAENNKFLNLWDDSQSLLKEADSALTSRNQQTVDSYAQRLEELLVELKKAIADMAGVDSITIEKPVTVEPEGDYCNIKSHPVWIVLFWISFAINLSAGALAFMYFYTKRKKTTDDTPLVDYDITDDAE
ncbi:MAG: hypothetical protein E7539_01760 [Ruminococcaceae bacterium]|nr:hypothetical protein [Oscillospiraceae bacterium]